MAMSALDRFDELPILAELEGQIERAAQRRLEDAAVAAPRLARPRPRLGSRLRVPRRVAVLASLVFLVAATATATVIWPGGEAPPGQTVTLLESQSGTGLRSLQVHEMDSELCPTLVLADTVDTVCVPVPASREGTVRTASSAFTQFVYGLTGSQVRAVSLWRAGGERHVVATRPLPRSSELPPATRSGRYFLARLPLSRQEAVKVRLLPAPGSKADRRTSSSCWLKSADNAGCRVG
jgi:hypothetical protein